MSAGEAVLATLISAPCIWRAHPMRMQFAATLRTESPVLTPADMVLRQQLSTPRAVAGIPRDRIRRGSGIGLMARLSSYEGHSYSSCRMIRSGPELTEALSKVKNDSLDIMETWNVNCSALSDSRNALSWVPVIVRLLWILF